MDPIKTAVKYALIPLRFIVELGEAYIGEQTEPDSAPRPTQSAKPQAHRPQARQQRRAPRPKPDPQASREPKDLDNIALARKVETVIFRDRQVPKGAIDV